MTLRSYTQAVVVCSVVLLGFGAVAQAPAQQPAASGNAATQTTRSDEDKRFYRTAMEDADQKIAAEVQSHSELMKNLEYLTTEIGARLTGSPQMNRASDWTLQRFHNYGIDAHLETAEIPHAWTRGQDTAQITSPINKVIEVRSAGWSKATSGPVTGNVLVIDAQTLADLDKYKGKLKGAIVMVRPPAEIPPDNDQPNNAYDAVITPSHGVPKPNAGGGFRQRFQMMRALAAENPAAVLFDSGKTDSLFNMTTFSRYEPSQAPMAFVTHEDYSLIYRLAKQAPVSMKVNLVGTFSLGPAKASITVAEIKGSQFPDERVIIGGHLDSWDLGQGALDNGTGAMATLEAARTLEALGWKPKRTITFVLFTGEEQGGVGANTFVTNHASEIPKIDAVLIQDTGTGKVFSIALEDQYETASLMEEIYRPLQEVFDLDPLSTRYFGSSDHVEFLDKGVPAYFCLQKPAHYREAHHSQSDTFDKVIPGQINEGAAFLAAWAWNVSEMPPALPHHQPRPERNLE